MIELQLNTDVGELTAIFISDTIDNHKTVWTGWIKEYPGVITQAETIEEAMNQLPGILDMLLKVEMQMLINND